jgi:hypothetical protein
MNPKIWLSSPHIGSNELQYVNEAFATNWIAPLGPHVNAFEHGLQEQTQTKITNERIQTTHQNHHGRYSWNNRSHHRIQPHPIQNDHWR